MKIFPFLVSCMVLFILGTINATAQSDPEKKNKIDAKNTEEEDGPIMFKFEPDYLSAIEKRHLEMARARLILDTLDISENKRRKLLRDLYKNGLTKRLSKALVADTKFEDAEN